MLPLVLLAEPPLHYFIGQLGSRLEHNRQGAQITRNMIKTSS